MPERHAEHEAFVAMTLQLIADYELLPAGSVIRCAARCRHDLVATGLQGGRLLAATEGMARARLRQRLSLDAA